MRDGALQVPPGWMLEEGQQYIGQPPWYELTSSGDLEALQLEGLEAADLNDFTLDQLLAVSMMVGPCRCCHACVPMNSSQSL